MTFPQNFQSRSLITQPTDHWSNTNSRENEELVSMFHTRGKNDLGPKSLILQIFAISLAQPGQGSFNVSKALTNHNACHPG